jgi:hypothetical protein
MSTAIENYDRFIAKFEKQELPRSVYKYLRFDENTYTNLNEKKLWFSDPKKYNDPFDSRLINPLQLYPSDDIREYFNYRKHLGINKPEETADNIEYTIELYEQNPNEILGEFHENINKTAIAVSCFSKDQNNILMWSHYADGHRGLCLEFSPHEDTDFFRPTRFRPVKYSNECKADNYLRDTARTLHNMVCTKSTIWKYENEIRIMILNEKEGLRPYNDRTLKSVTFGCRTTELNIKLTKSILGDSVEYRRCELGKTGFNLNVVPL